MSDYRQLLVAIDLSDQSRAIAAKSVELARQWNAQLRLLHVIEFVPVEPMSDALVPVVQIDERVIARAREQIEALAAALGLPGDSCRVATGNVKAEILRQARELNADLIVLGCRERHGLSILVNLTEDTVLHGAPCDVLAMRVR
ncbi:MAG TPA: universal stress protein [Steroidobacteraceae bacterium]|nr:universal stress protein [Steroidobacteraceae bacterium]